MAGRAGCAAGTEPSPPGAGEPEKRVLVIMGLSQVMPLGLRRLKRRLSKKKNTIWVTKQHAEELTVTVCQMKANGTVSLPREPLEFSARGVRPVNRYSWLEKWRKGGNSIDPQYGEGSSFGEVPSGRWVTQSFADRIPEFGADWTWEEEGSGA